MAKKNKTYLFCGVGGSGMSSLAKIILSQGHMVYGSDRNYDQGRFTDHFEKLKTAGVQMVAQDGSGVTSDIDALIVSSAVESSIPDIAKAQELGIHIIKRAELLAEICNGASSITVGGTNGKSTITGMIGWVLDKCGYNPTVINGGGMLNFDRDNAVIGDPKRIVVETDESDGTITNFHPSVAVLTNISEDHKGMDELLSIFEQYLQQSQYQVLNIDCPNIAKLAEKFPDAMTYSMNDVPDDMNLMVPGKHNQSNAMATLKVAEFCHIDRDKALKALSEFKGITSRLEVVGKKNSITVIDDFGHNPDKIEAGLKTLKESTRRLILMYQPHGFAPTRQHKDELIDVFAKYLTPNDIFYMSEILYFGGTVEKDISSADIIEPLQEKGVQAHYIPNKSDIQTEILKQAKPDDTICIMGARDDSLRAMAHDILSAL
jgi:UDP-N-acetylmuramate--alanine ligase